MKRLNSFQGLIFLVACCCSYSLTKSEDSGDNDADGGIGATGKGQKSATVLGDIPLSATNFSYHARLDENYILQWNFNSTHILLSARVKTTGYIGLGISHNGNMYPADVIVAWVKDGRVHFADYHTTGYVMPVIDVHQDWYLLSGHEEDDHTTITVLRQHNACDDEDLPITTDTTRLIYSYSPNDPVSDNNLLYHGSTRGTKSILLLSPSTINENSPNTLPDDVIALDILNNNFSVPSKPTTYNCEIWKLPHLEEKHHIIRYEPVIQKGHERLIHHMILYTCDQDIDDNLVGTNYDCYRDTPQGMVGCFHIVLAWGIGGNAFDYPAHVGHSMGTSLDPVYFRLETHYNNFYERHDYVDNSGIRMFLTKQIRQHDAGMLSVGVTVDDNQMVPPYAESFLNRGHCHEDCVALGLGDDTIYAFAGSLHSHMTGKSLSARIIRNGTELPPLLEDVSFDVDYQELRHFREERAIKKGDTLLTDCIYDSSKRTKFTFGGLGIKEEMCLSFILYYPRQPLNFCSTQLDYKIPPIISQRYFNKTVTGIEDLYRMVSNLDWTEKENREAFAEIIQYSDVVNYCGQPSGIQIFRSPQPTIDKPYQRDDQCKA